MESKIFSFNTFNEYTKDGIGQALKECNPKNKQLIFVCIGSDLVLGDSLGPLVGTMLKKNNLKSYIYGTLNFPVTAKEVDYARTHIKQMHPESLIVAIDAAVGNQDDVGTIRVMNKGLKPGLGVDKNLGIIGDVSIVGIVASKSLQNYNLFSSTRLNLIFKMAEKISCGIENYISAINQSDVIREKSFGA